ncbi:hypothetical protein EW146_g8083 [Bondarzewia mesenterica]|uniref:Uncharacterized protein n=1 Tax=Bondarzewia mesenterica TaxID=1095465 RepID=A0A4S4LIZ6_9AGAM|nr:hypothetical protein EW146_g8083 [Bondarzewia mesenterica]
MLDTHPVYPREAKCAQASELNTHEYVVLSTVCAEAPPDALQLQKLTLHRVNTHTSQAKTSGSGCESGSAVSSLQGRDEEVASACAQSIQSNTYHRPTPRPNAVILDASSSNCTRDDPPSTRIQDIQRAIKIRKDALGPSWVSRRTTETKGGKGCACKSSLDSIYARALAVDS